MRLARTWSVALVGIDAHLVEVEVSISGGLPRTVVVGLPDTSLSESRDRCKAAVSGLGRSWPQQAVTINLSPAALPKSGSHFDLPIALAVLGADMVVPETSLQGVVMLGELGLEGRVRQVRGVLPSLLAASEQGFTRAIVPLSQVREARLVPGIQVVGVEWLADAVAWLRGEGYQEPPTQPRAEPPPERRLDLADVVGQFEARWALEVAAAGGHHMYFRGPPGVGKTLLAERLPGILPDLTHEHSLEVSAIHSLAGRPLEEGLVTRPPYSDPHHSASVPALVGGGSRIARPGAVSLAHRGVLFLDEAPEFSPRALDALRTPLEAGRIVLARSVAHTTYPARFQLLLAANPCPCGKAGTPGAACTCAPIAVRRYAERISGPILDRIDITLQMNPMSRTYLKAAGDVGEASESVAGRVADARARQASRLGPLGFGVNAEVPSPVLRRHVPLPGGIEQLERAVARGQLSARGVDRVLRVAWSIADLSGSGVPAADHLMSALGMRLGDYWGSDARVG